MKSKKVLYISYDGMTDPLGQSQVIPYVAGLTAKGYAFTILSCEKPQRLKSGQQHIEQLLASHGISWEFVTYHKSPPVLSTVWDVSQLIRTAIRLHKKHDFQVVHCRSYIAALVGLHLKKKFSLKFIFDMRGLWADERVDGKLWNLKNPFYKTVYNYFKNREQEFLEEADATISLTNKAKQDILSWKKFRKKIAPIHIIPCCVDVSHFSGENISQPAKEEKKKLLGIQKDDFVISYLGSIGTWYMLPEMLQFFKLLQKEIPNSKFLFITPDPKEFILQKAVDTGVDSNAIIVTEAARKDVPLLLSLSSYSIYFILPAYSKISSSPTKQGEIMAMGIPAIFNKGIGDADEIMTASKAGILLEDFSEETMISVVARIKSGHDQFSAEQIRNSALHYYALSEGVEKYTEVYAGL